MDFGIIDVHDEDLVWDIHGIFGLFCAFVCCMNL